MADITDLVNQLTKDSVNVGLNDYTTFESQYRQALREIARQRAGLSDLQSFQTNRLNEDFNLNQEDLIRSKDDTLRSLVDNLSSNGILHSGINIGEQGRIGENFIRGIGDLVRSKTRSIEDLIRSIQEANQGLLNREESLGFQKAQMDAQRALEQAMTQAQGTNQGALAPGLGQQPATTPEWQGLAAARIQNANNARNNPAPQVQAQQTQQAQQLASAQPVYQADGTYQVQGMNNQVPNSSVNNVATNPNEAYAIAARRRMGY